MVTLAEVFSEEALTTALVFAQEDKDQAAATARERRTTTRSHKGNFFSNEKNDCNKDLLSSICWGNFGKTKEIRRIGKNTLAITEFYTPNI